MSIYSIENFDRAFKNMLDNELINKIGVSILKREIQVNALKVIDGKSTDEPIFEDSTILVYYILSGWIRIKKDSVEEMLFKSTVSCGQSLISFQFIRDKFLKESEKNPEVMDWWSPVGMPGVSTNKRWTLKSKVLGTESGFIPSFIPAFNDITVPEMLWKEISKFKNNSFIVYEGE